MCVKHDSSGRAGGGLSTLGRCFTTGGNAVVLCKYVACQAVWTRVQDVSGAQAITERSEASKSDARSLRHNSSSGRTPERSLPHGSSGKDSERSLPHELSAKESTASLQQIREGEPESNGLQESAADIHEAPQNRSSMNSAVIDLLSTK